MRGYLVVLEETRTFEIEVSAADYAAAIDAAWARCDMSREATHTVHDVRDVIEGH